MPPRKISDMFSCPKADTPPPESPSTPNTRKRHRNYAELHNYGLDGSPKASSTHAPPLPKKSRPNPLPIPLQLLQPS
jgi:hypothetical protein